MVAILPQSSTHFGLPDNEFYVMLTPFDQLVKVVRELEKVDVLEALRRHDQAILLIDFLE